MNIKQEKAIFDNALERKEKVEFLLGLLDDTYSKTKDHVLLPSPIIPPPALASGPSLRLSP